MKKVPFGELAFTARFRLASWPDGPMFMKVDIHDSDVTAVNVDTGFGVELSNATEVLVPEDHPEVRESILANNAWLRKHGPDYEGQWVALFRGQLLGADKSLARLREQRLPPSALIVKCVFA